MPMLLSEILVLYHVIFCLAELKVQSGHGTIQRFSYSVRGDPTGLGCIVNAIVERGQYTLVNTINLNTWTQAIVFTLESDSLMCHCNCKVFYFLFHGIEKERAMTPFG
jgi:hypothetical protein